MDYIMLNNQKIELTEEQSREIKRIYGVQQVKLCDIPDGDTFKIGKYEFIKFPSKNGVIPVVLKGSLGDMAFGDSNNFAKSKKLRSRLDDFLKEITAVIGKDNVEDFKVNLTALDGTGYDSIWSKVSLPTLDFYRENRLIFEKHKLDLYWWLATADSSNNRFALCVTPGGDVYYRLCNLNDIGVRPFCKLNSKIFVSKV